MSNHSIAGPLGTLDPRSEEFAGRLSAFVSECGLLDPLALDRAQRARRQSGERLDLVLTRLGLISETELTKVLARFLGLPLMEPTDLPEQPLHVDRVQVPFLLRNRILPIAERSGALLLAVADPFNSDPIVALGYLLGQRVELCMMSTGDIERALERLYGQTDISRAEVGTPSEPATEEDVTRLADMASEAPIIRLVHDLITRAVEVQASDIHLEPHEASVHVRYRIDGTLSMVETLPLSMRAAVTSRVKIMAQLNIAERRLPQDGRIKITVRGKEIDLRASTMPTMLGESVVLRILDRSSVQLDFGALGFAGAQHDAFVRLLQQPNGIILVTGPTGSGKTTTLYAALNTLNRAGSKLFTVEDPIEYQLAGVNQIQVQPKIGLTFAHALRSILRQDPDIIMVGEIRDAETAQMAIQAALTGHLVLSTLHTNSAASTVTRLLDMGVEDYLLTSTFAGILAQRLVRRLCKECAAPAEASPLLLKTIGHRQLDLGRFRQKVGCRACRNTGFAGRTAISELLVMSGAVRKKILGGRNENDIESAALDEGMVTIFEDGLAKALRGETTIEEVLSVTRMV